MRKKPTHLKEIAMSERLFFHYKLDATTYVLYDSDMGEPVAYGSYNIVGSTVSKLPTASTIFYFELDTSKGWKLKQTYKPKTETTTVADAKNKINEKLNNG